MFDALRIRREPRFAASTSPAICAYVAAGLDVALMHPLYVGTAAGAAAVRPFMPRLEFGPLMVHARDTILPVRVRALCDLTETESLRIAADGTCGRQAQ